MVLFAANRDLSDNYGFEAPILSLGLRWVNHMTEAANPRVSIGTDKGLDGPPKLWKKQGRKTSDPLIE